MWCFEKCEKSGFSVPSRCHPQVAEYRPPASTDRDSLDLNRLFQVEIHIPLLNLSTTWFTCFSILLRTRISPSECAASLPRHPERGEISSRIRCSSLDSTTHSLTTATLFFPKNCSACSADASYTEAGPDCLSTSVTMPACSRGPL